MSRKPANSLDVALIVIVLCIMYAVLAVIIDHTFEPF